MSSGISAGSARAAALALLALTLAGCGLQPSDRLAKPVGPALSQALNNDYTLTPAGAQAAEPMSAPAPVAAPTLGLITVYAVDLRFEPKISSIDRPGRYTVRLVNTDELPHDITLPDGTRLYAEPGRTAEGEFTIGQAGVSFICAVPGHREAGMVGQINVDNPVAHSPVP
jgi:nitrite reductase (NO-forming)